MALVCLWVNGTILYNSTPSIDEGFYTRVWHDPPLNDHTLVVFCLEGEFEKIALERQYTPHGSCSDGTAPLLKPVVAIAGDTVAFDAATGITVNGKRLPNTMPLEKDSHGRVMKLVAASGERIVKPDEVWVAIEDKHSFDSRYFGPIRLDSIRYPVEPLWTW